MERRKGGKKEGRMDGRTDGRTDGRKDIWTDGMKEGRMDGRTEGRKEGTFDVAGKEKPEKGGPDQRLVLQRFFVPSVQQRNTSTSKNEFRKKPSVQ